jgi:hypothetical protein
MGNSKQLAKLLGSFLIAMTISAMLNPHIRDTVAVTQTYLAGSLWLLAELAIIRNHNFGKLRWPILITFIGWFAIIGGLGRMFFPASVQNGSGNSSLFFVFQIFLLLIGIALTFKAYWNLFFKHHKK